MEEITREIQNLIEKIKGITEEREKIKEEFRKEVDILKQKVAELTKENARYRKVYDNARIFSNSVLNIEEKEQLKEIQRLDKEVKECKENPESPKTGTWVLRKRRPSLKEDDSITFHSIKDRIRKMGEDPQHFIYQLSSLGKKMAEYYRNAHNGENPSKRDEKINDKHNSPVCVYAEEDWEYLDYLLRTSLGLGVLE